MIKFDASKIVAKLQHVIDHLPMAADNALMDVANFGANVAKTKTFYTVRSENGLKGKTTAQLLGNGRAQIIANTMYASWVNFGNGPGINGRIYPVTAKALHFTINGQEVFAKSVRVSQPKPFMTNAYNELRQLGSINMVNGLKTLFK